MKTVMLTHLHKLIGRVTCLFWGKKNLRDYIVYLHVLGIDKSALKLN